jgi:hypothetical protein
MLEAARENRAVERHGTAIAIFRILVMVKKKLPAFAWQEKANQ